jgi:hypothetical protein
VNRSGPLETDGTLAVVRLKNGAPTRAFVLDGMFLDFEGKRLLEQPVAGTYSRRLGQ